MPFVAGIILLAIPVTNPGVQDCGAPFAYAITGRGNERVLITPGTPDAEERRALRDQEPCSERVATRMTWGTASLVLFFVACLAGAVLGLVDDRMRLRRSPEFERLLRERPPDAPGDLWDKPVVPEEDIGTALPDLEGSDVESLTVWSIAAVCVLLIVAGVLPTFDAFTSAAIMPLLLLVLFAVLARFVAAVDVNVLERGLREPGGTLEHSLPIAVACDFAGRLRPSFGAAGIESHALVRRGVPRTRVLVDVGLAFALAAAVHGVLLVVLLLLTLVSGGLDVGAWPPHSLLLVPIGVAFAIAGAVWLPARLRRLPCTFGRVTLARLRELWSRTPVDVLMMGGLAACLPLLHGLVVLAAVEAFGGHGSSIAVLFVVTLALAFGTLAPVPEGLLAADVVMVLGLSFAGVDAVVAVASVLAWRAAMYWLPMIPGYVMTRRLLDRGVL